MSDYIRKGIGRVFIMVYIGSQMRLINGYKKITEDQRVIISMQSDIIKANTILREELTATTKNTEKCSPGYKKRNCRGIDKQVNVCVKFDGYQHITEDGIVEYGSEQCY